MHKYVLQLINFESCLVNLLLKLNNLILCAFLCIDFSISIVIDTSEFFHLICFILQVLAVQVVTLTTIRTHYKLHLINI